MTMFKVDHQVLQGRAFPVFCSFSLPFPVFHSFCLPHSEACFAFSSFPLIFLGLFQLSAVIYNSSSSGAHKKFLTQTCVSFDQHCKLQPQIRIILQVFSIAEWCIRSSIIILCILFQLKHRDCFLSGDDRCFVYHFVLRRLILVCS